PALAAALVRAGHVASVREAFDKYLDTSGAAFVPRRGAPVRDVARIVRDAGGVASVAHPGLHRDPDLLARLAAGGRDSIDAIEVFHTDHDSETTARLLALAESSGLLVTGGSDFHGDSAGRTVGLGRIALPQGWFDRLSAAAGPVSRHP
ncbi:MAG: hypothetical protein M3R55_06270, partial [Acidobacteriota bacterium]|nr:hypothetical protein [Acidobacteriota bacterium]